jgi:hypothetical protein
MDFGSEQRQRAQSDQYPGCKSGVPKESVDHKGDLLLETARSSIDQPKQAV